MRDTKRQCVRFVRFVRGLRIAPLVRLVVEACESRGGESVYLSRLASIDLRHEG